MIDNMIRVFRAVCWHVTISLLVFVGIFISYTYVIIEQYSLDVCSAFTQILVLTGMTLGTAVGTYLYIYGMYKGIAFSIAGEPIDEMSIDNVGIIETRIQQIKNNIDFAKIIIGIMTSISVAFATTFLSDNSNVAALLSNIGQKHPNYVELAFMLYVVFLITALMISRDLWKRIRNLTTRVEQLHEQERCRKIAESDNRRREMCQYKYTGENALFAGIIIVSATILCGTYFCSKNT